MPKSVSPQQNTHDVMRTIEEELYIHSSTVNQAALQWKCNVSDLWKELNEFECIVNSSNLQSLHYWLTYMHSH